MTAKRTDPRKKQGDRSFISLLAITFVIGAAIIGYVVLKPKPAATIVDPNLPLPEARGHVIGSDSAPVEIVMYGDFECPGCGQFVNITEPDVRRLLVATGAARFRFMDYPLRDHPSTMFAHNAAACAGDQNKFFEMHDRIFAGQYDWSEFANRKDMNAPRVMKRYASELGLDTDAFNACFDSRRLEPNVMANQRTGIALNVQVTPTFIIGKRMLPGALAYDVIKALVDSATAEAKAAPPARDTTAGK